MTRFHLYNNNHGNMRIWRRVVIQTRCVIMLSLPIDTGKWKWVAVLFLLCRYNKNFKRKTFIKLLTNLPTDSFYAESLESRNVGRGDCTGASRLQVSWHWGSKARCSCPGNNKVVLTFLLILDCIPGVIKIYWIPEIRTMLILWNTQAFVLQ